MRVCTACRRRSMPFHGSMRLAGHNRSSLILCTTGGGGIIAYRLRLKHNTRSLKAINMVEDASNSVSV